MFLWLLLIMVCTTAYAQNGPLREGLTNHSFQRDFEAAMGNFGAPIHLTIELCSGERVITCVYQTPGQARVMTYTVLDAVEVEVEAIFYVGSQSSDRDEVQIGAASLFKVADPTLTSTDLTEIVEEILHNLGNIVPRYGSSTRNGKRFTASCSHGQVVFAVKLQRPSFRKK